MNTKQIALPFVVVIAVLLAFSSPAAAYTGDYPLMTYEHDTVNGGLVFDTVTDGSKYRSLYPSVIPLELPGGRPVLYQDLTVDIPEGATVKTARLYNYYCWSCWENRNDVGIPANAKLTLTDTSTDETWTTGDLTHDYTPANVFDCPNPIVYDDVVHYWDVKNERGVWAFPSGTFAWDVTDLVTHSGTYTASICDPRDRARVGDERFVTFGFGLVVVYEDASGCSWTEYWVNEGCDVLFAGYWGVTYEEATSEAVFADPEFELEDASSATLTTVLDCSNYWMYDLNRIYFNGVHIGASHAAGARHMGVDTFDVLSLLSDEENICGIQDRYDYEGAHNAFLVVGVPIPADVRIEPETLNLNSSGKFTAFITLPEGCDVADINISTVECEGAPAIEGSIIHGKDTLRVKFNREDLREDLPTGDAVELTVTGELTDGTPFKGSDTICVIAH